VFLGQQNLYNITRNFTFTAIIAIGMTFVIITGGIDLSVGSVLCLCSMVIAVTMHAGFSLEIGVAAAIATGLLVGAFNGVDNDPLRAFVVRYDLRGVLVEPQPEPFAELTRTYDGCKRVKLRRAAVGLRSGTATL
jgi:ABC-type xylose transport system permease subunit